MSLESKPRNRARVSTRRALLAPSVTLVPVVALAGCVDNLAICVDSGFAAAIVVQVRDAVTGAPLAEGARGAIRDGGYVDSLRPPNSDASGRLLTLAGGAGRAGTYDVTVVYAGYQEWRQRGVVVSTDGCGVAGRLLHADLQPLPRGGG
jgi:hypothetical protein